MQIHLKIYLLTPVTFMLSWSLSAQFYQNIDSLSVDIKKDSTTETSIISGIHFSGYKNDTEIFNAIGDYNSSVDATKVMQTKVPGLLVNANSQTPGASSSLIFRGYRSILGNNEPLIILDGLPIDNSQWGRDVGGTDLSNRLIDINPNDIESIELIKSGAGRAKYGIVGGNGVIVIKSKKGINSLPKISIRSSIAIDQVTSLPRLQNIYAQGRPINGVRTYRGPEFNEGFSWGPKISDLEFDGFAYPFDQNGRLVAKGTGNGIAANTYDATDFYQSGMSSNINANIKGGHNDLRYYASAGYNNQQGVIPTNQFKRYNFFANLDYQISDRFSLSGSASINISRAIRTQRGSNINGVMLGVLRTPATFDNSNNSSDPVNDPTAYILDNGAQRSFRNGIYNNPYWTINKNPHEDNVTRNILNVGAHYKILENLEFTTSIGRDQFSDERQGGIDINPERDVGSAYENNTQYTSQNLDVGLIHNGKVSDDLTVTSSIAVNYNTSKRTLETKNVDNLLSSDNVNISNGINLTTTNDEIDRKRLGTVLAIDAVYNEYLYLDASLRQDYSNKFGAATNGYLSYGLGVGLELSEILFDSHFNDNPQILLHASYGKFGSDITVGNNFTTFNLSNVITGDGFIDPLTTNSPELTSIGVNRNLTAESTAVFDFGIDLKSKDKRYEVDLLFYKEVSTDLIVIRETVPSSGISTIYENRGAIDNVGMEVSLGAKIIETHNYIWDFSLAFSKNKNTIRATNINDESIRLSGFNSSRTEAIVDEAYGSIVGSGFLLNENDQLVIDSEGFPFAESDLILGDPNPDWTMYINNNVSLFDKLSISASIDIKSGGDMWCGTCGVQNYFGISELAASEVGQSIIFPGVTQDGQVNDVSAELVPNNRNTNDFYRVRYGFGGLAEMSIYNTSWIRLRNISIDYNLKDLFKTNYLSEFTIGLFANNLIILSDYPSIDPETSLLGNNSTRGLEYYNNPGSRQIGLMLNLTF